MAQCCGKEEAQFIGFGIYLDSGELYFIPMNSSFKSKIMQILSSLLQSSIIKICFQLQFILTCIYDHFWEINDIQSVEDPYLLSWVSNSERDLSFHQILEDYLQLSSVSEDSSSQNEAEMNSILLFYSDLQYSIALHQIIAASLEEQEIQNYQSMEISLCLLISSLQRNGILIDASSIEKTEKLLQEYLLSLSDHAKKLLNDKSFNISSTNDIHQALFEKLNLPNAKKTSKKKQPGTSKDVLLPLCKLHPLPALILDYRTTKSLHSSQVIPLIDLWKKSKSENSNLARICSSWHITHSPTGRLTLTDPSLQQLVREKTIFTFPDGREFSVDIRDCFKADTGCSFLSFDYSQLEIRILAHFCKDPSLISFLNSGNDVHSLIASHWLNIPVKNVSQNDRQNAKEICYGKFFFLFILIT